MNNPLLQMEGISKAFPGVKALENVSFSVARGQVHGLLGENGAGKSTLMKILSGAYTPDVGSISFDGQPLRLRNPHHAQQVGIVTIYQEFNLFPTLTVAENIFIGREPGRVGTVSWRAMRQQTKSLTDRLGVNLDPMARVRNLSIAEQQMVEIARALSMESRLIIMDEPTAALSETEIKRLFEIVRGLKASGISVIFITHHLDEVHQICDRVTVLRDGQLVGTCAADAVTVDDIIRMMVGYSAAEFFRREQAYTADEVVLRVSGLHSAPSSRSAIRLQGITFEVRRGEILGIAGLVGAGRTEIARAIFGADKFAAGRIEIGGQSTPVHSPQDAIRHKMGLIPEDRKKQALFAFMSVRENVTIVILKKLLRWLGFVRQGAERAILAEYQSRLHIRMAHAEQRIANLSGGNQQKAIIARWLVSKPQVLIVDEPTRGIDVAAKSEVHQLLDELAREGIAIIMISSELMEILSMADRIITVRQGRITGEFSRHEATEEKLMQAMTLS